jgi:hypothetical protein
MWRVILLCMWRVILLYVDVGGYICVYVEDYICVFFAPEMQETAETMGAKWRLSGQATENTNTSVGLIVMCVLGGFNCDVCIGRVLLCF